MQICFAATQSGLDYRRHSDGARNTVQFGSELITPVSVDRYHGVSHHMTKLILYFLETFSPNNLTYYV